MSTVKVIEIICEGDSIEKAIDNGLKDAEKTVRGIKSVWVEGIKAKVKNGKVSSYRLDCKLSFIVD